MNTVLLLYTLQLDSLMLPAPGSEPLAFKSVFAATPGLQAKACIERALKQVRLEVPHKSTAVRNTHVFVDQGCCRTGSCQAVQAQNWTCFVVPHLPDRFSAPSAIDWEHAVPSAFLREYNAASREGSVTTVCGHQATRSDSSILSRKSLTSSTMNVAVLAQSELQLDEDTDLHHNRRHFRQQLHQRR